MNNKGVTGITTVILLISVILIGATAASVIMGNSNETSERDLEDMVDDIVDEISTYVQIKDIMGKYYSTDGTQRIKRIATLTKPLISVDIDVSEMIIKLCNGEQIKILYYSGQAEFIQSNPLFEHPIWDNMGENSFGLIVTLDKDNSTINHDTINDNTDMAYIAIKLSEDLAMKKGDTMTITFFTSTGTPRTFTVEAPLPINQVVSL